MEAEDGSRHETEISAGLLDLFTIRRHLTRQIPSLSSAPSFTGRLSSLLSDIQGPFASLPVSLSLPSFLPAQHDGGGGGHHFFPPSGRADGQSTTENPTFLRGGSVKKMPDGPPRTDIAIRVRWLRLGLGKGYCSPGLLCFCGE